MEWLLTYALVVLAWWVLGAVAGTRIGQRATDHVAHLVRVAPPLPAAVRAAWHRGGRAVRSLRSEES